MEAPHHHFEGRQETMSEKIVQLNEEIIKSELKELVRSSVEETLNGLLEQEAQQLTGAAKYERSAERQGPESDYNIGRCGAEDAETQRGIL